MQAEILIDRRALRANVSALRAFLAPAGFIAVVKADAYGHGLELVAPAIADLVDAFGVYEVSEASALRRLGIGAPIHLLSAIPPQEFEAALDADALFACWSRGGWLADLLTLCARREKRARLQLKVETGLARLGVAPREARDLVAHLRAESLLELSGAYSHLASAEELDSRYTMEQLATFEAAIPAGTVGQRHLAASAAAMLWPRTRLDAVRIGIAIYGLWPSEACRARLGALLPLRPVLAWRSHLVSVRAVAAETPVGYGCTYRPATETRIGVLPIGYAEGLPRALSNRGSVIVEGVLCPIVGRVCMNMTFVDLASAPKALPGSRVTIIGAEGTAELSVDAVARDCETISYEILARLPQQIPRSIVGNG